ncbi:MAG: tetratricopeptide repeat protein [Anaerolineales bacterium]|nr:tetratricopeptide repeat protein [Anaerolineales bacterium]
MKKQAKRGRDASVLESFTERVERLADELRLAIHWDRPSILLAIYQSRYTMLDAQTALAERLRDLGQQFGRYIVNSDNADIPLHLSELSEDKRAHTIFFVDGLHFGGREALRALNIRREFFVDHRIRVIFWLTEKEAISLPQEAPDFWRFRGRVVDFMDRPVPERAAEIGRALAWSDFEDRTLCEDTEAKITLRLALLGDLPEGETTLATRVQLLFTLGGLYWAKGELDESSHYFQEAIRVAEPLDDAHLLSLCYNGLGNVYSDLGRHDEALAAFQKAIQLDPKDASPWNGLGNVCSDLGRHDEAIAAFDKAIQLDPKYAYPWNGLGSVYSDLGRHEEASAAYQKAIQLDAKDAYPWNGLGNVYRDLGRHEDAIAAFQKAIELDPKFAEAYSNLTDTLDDLERTDEAVKLYEKSFELKPRGKPMNALGLHYQRQNNLEEALEVHKKAVELNPNDASYRVSLASVYRKLGRETDAAEQIALARPLMEKENEYNRACFESICGNMEEALRLLKIALEKRQTSLAWVSRDPDFDFIRDDPRFKEIIGANECSET